MEECIIDTLLLPPFFVWQFQYTLVMRLPFPLPQLVDLLAQAAKLPRFRCNQPGRQSSLYSVMALQMKLGRPRPFF